MAAALTRTKLVACFGIALALLVVYANWPRENESPPATSPVAVVEEYPDDEPREITRTVHASDFGASWPLVPMSATLACERSPNVTGTDHIYVSVEVLGGERYALSGGSEYHFGIPAFPMRLWRPQPGNPEAKVSLAPLADAARRLCDEG